MVFEHKSIHESDQLILELECLWEGLYRHCRKNTMNLMQ